MDLPQYFMGYFQISSLERNKSRLRPKSNKLKVLIMKDKIATMNQTEKKKKKSTLSC